MVTLQSPRVREILQLMADAKGLDKLPPIEYANVSNYLMQMEESSDLSKN